MRKTLAALMAAATIAIATVAVPSAAEAQRWHGGWGWRGGFRGPGPFFGGLFAGALIAGALAPRYYYPGYYYRRPVYAYGPPCWRTYWNGWRWVQYPVC